MIQIGDKIVSRELFDNHFICDLKQCEGNCCVFGDAGAPLEDEEAELLQENLARIQPFMRVEGIRAVNEKGSWVVDDDQEKVTPLVGRDECAYAVFENGIARCAIEHAFEAGAVPFRKPVSCHLYPIRLSRLSNAVALNYHRWGICEPARILGEKKGIPVFKFLKDPITRVFGLPFYEELDIVYREIIQAGDSDE
jgi:hypothetical protein